MNDNMQPAPTGEAAAPINAETTVPLKDYPALKGAQPGAKVKGTWSGTVRSVEGESATISYDELAIEPNENMADKELARMTGQDQGPSNNTDSADDGEGE